MSSKSSIRNKISPAGRRYSPWIAGTVAAVFLFGGPDPALAAPAPEPGPSARKPPPDPRPPLPSHRPGRPVSPSMQAGALIANLLMMAPSENIFAFIKPKPPKRRKR
jgi:hypothetical protein